MSSSFDNLAKDLYKILTNKEDNKPKAYTSKVTVSKIKDGTMWVRFPGNDFDTPVSNTVEATPGDSVRVQVANGRAVVVGNESAPSTDDSRANMAMDSSEEAKLQASRAKAAADAADAEAQRAHEIVDKLSDDVDALDERVETAEGNIEQIEGRVDTAETKITGIETSISALDDRVGDAETEIGNIEDRIVDVNGRVDKAEEDLRETDRLVGEAQKSATSALYGLSTVQDIVGTLNWVEDNAEYIWAIDEEFYEKTVYYTVKNINFRPKKITLDIVNSFLYKPIVRENYLFGYVKYKNEESLNFQVIEDPLVGALSEYYEKLNDDEYILTSDEEIDVTKTYYWMVEYLAPSVIGPRYVEVSFEKVENPVADEIYKYYTADTQTSMANYIKSHLALTDDGLYVMKDSSGWKYKVTNEGAYILDPGNIPKAIYKTDVQLGNDLDPHRMILSALALSFFFNQKLVGKFGYDEMFESYGLYAENVLIKGAGNALRLDNAVNGTYQGQYILETRANGHLSLKPGLRRTEED